MSEARKMLVVKLVRSRYGRSDRQGRILKSLGLKKINAQRELPDCDTIRGMINKVNHLVQVVG
ncbi:MAG: 50S ribosomal protein L30 [Magnetococcales bacterium]|nr:50S ribosomal protein L30 [Magnetococcales bacterium]